MSKATHLKPREIPMTDVTKLTSWQALKTHAVQKKNLKEMFAADPARFKKMSFALPGLLVTARRSSSQYSMASNSPQQIGKELGIQYLVKNRPGRVTYAMSNSFGFGGTNCSLLLGRAG